MDHSHSRHATGMQGDSDGKVQVHEFRHYCQRLRHGLAKIKIFLLILNNKVKSLTKSMVVLSMKIQLI